MADEPKANLVNLNVGLHARAAPPEEGVAAVIIDGTPIHNVTALAVHSATDGYTTVTLVFNAKIGGFTAETPVKANT